MLNLAQLRWSGHVTRMDDSRLPKQLFHAELSTGKRHKGGQKKWYKDVLTSTLKAYNIPVDEWQALAQDRPAWRAAIREGTKHFETSRLQSLDDKRSAIKNRVKTLALLYLVSSVARSALPLSGFKLICANTSTDASSSKSKDYYYARLPSAQTALLGRTSQWVTLSWWPEKGFKDSLKAMLKALEMKCDSWEQKALDRPQ